MNNSGEKEGGPKQAAGQTTSRLISSGGPGSLGRWGEERSTVGKVLRLTLCPVAFASGHTVIRRHEQIAHSVHCTWSATEETLGTLSELYRKLVILSYSLFNNQSLTILML